MRRDPARDWILSLICSAIVLTGIIVWNAWAFDTVSRGGVIGSPMKSVPSTFNNSSLDTVHDIFAKRAAEESKYESGAYRYADPSL